MGVLKVEPGISSASVKNIPDKWDAAWFRRFIANFLMGGDVRNAIAGTGITITGNLASPFATISATGGGGGGAVTKIYETVLVAPGASVTLSAIPGTYRNLILRITCAASVNTAPSLELQLNGDTGANYDASLGFLYGVNLSGNNSGYGTTSMQFSSPITTNGIANQPSVISIVIPNYAATVFNKVLTGTWAREDAASGANMYTGVLSGTWHNTAAVASILVTLSSGNFVAGSTFSLYGES